MSKKVLVLKGGFSSEREVSLITGSGASKALQELGYEVLEHDLTNVYDFLSLLETQKPDVVFNALHGNWGEDGQIQGFLDFLQIPYTHSGLRASSLGMDKDITKLICNQNDIKTPKGEKLTFAQYKSFGTNIKFPYVIKPVSDGSSVGVFIVKNIDDTKKVSYDNEQIELLVEEFIPGQEITVAVIDGKALAVTELCPKVDFYDYEAKYTNGITEHIIPANIGEDATKTAMEYAQKIHNLLGCNIISRSDFRYNKQDGVVFLEINTNPGLTPLSLVPEQFAYCGKSYNDLCQILVEGATFRKINEVQS